MRIGSQWREGAREGEEKKRKGIVPIVLKVSDLLTKDIFSVQCGTKITKKYFKNRRRREWRVTRGFQAKVTDNIQSWLLEARGSVIEHEVLNHTQAVQM